MLDQGNKTVESAAPSGDSEPSIDAVIPLLSALDEKSSGFSIHNYSFGIFTALGVVSIVALFLVSEVYSLTIGLVILSLFFFGAAVGYELRRYFTQKQALNAGPLEALMEAEDDPVCITDRSGNLIGTNAAYRKLFYGHMVTIQDMAGHSEIVAQHMREILDEGSKSNMPARVVRFISSNDEVFNSLLCCYNRTNYLVWIFRPYNAQAEQSELIDWFSTLILPFLEQTQMGVFLFNGAGELTYFNENGRLILGVSEAELGEQSFESMTIEKGVIDQAKETGRVEFEMVAVDLPPNTEFNISSGKALILREKFANDSSLNGRFSKIDLSRILENSPIAITAIDKSGVILEFNQAFSSIFVGATGQAPLIGENIRQLISKRSWVEIEARIDPTLRGMPPEAAIDIDIRKAQHVSRQAFLGAGTSRGENCVLLYVFDTTQQKKLEEQFNQAQKMQAVGQLAGGIAHDFNNLLTAIIGFCDLLLERHSAGDQSFADILQVKQNALRGANLVRQLLAFSRRQTLQPKLLNITDCLAELSNLIRRLIGEKIELNIIHGRDIGTVKVDQGQLEQVIINLAVNARDAMAGDGKLVISTQNISMEESQELGYALLQPGDYVEIRVTDTGHGIAKDKLEKVFEPFYTTKEVGKGTGLGLSTVYGIVKQTGGYIFAESEEGKGAVFRIFIPLFKGLSDEAIDTEHVKDEPLVLEAYKSTPTVSQMQAAARGDLTGKGTILVVEDESAVRKFTTRALSNKGYTVLEAENGEEALAIVTSQDHDISLMISDVVMPVMDGPKLAAEVRKFNPKIRIILISGYAEDAFRYKDDEEKFAFLAKPFSLDDLARRVKEELSREG